MIEEQAMEKLSLLALIPFEELQQLQDTIAQLNGIKSVITDPLGNPLTMPSNELPPCELIIHSPAAHTECLANFKDRSAHIRESRQTQYLSCPLCGEFGILGAAVPIVVGNTHLANWWISQYCPERTSEARIRQKATVLNIDGDVLIRQLAELPRHNAVNFDQSLSWIEHLVHRLTLQGYQNLMLSRDVAKARNLEEELNRYKTSLEEMIRDRTAGLMQINQRMKLEVLERELIEEQTERKSLLLDAVNQMLQSTLVPQSDTELAHRCLQLALKLTGSAFGFLVEYSNRQARFLAKSQPNRQRLPDREWQGESFHLNGVWKEIILSAEPVIRHEPLPGNQQTAGFPLIQTLLAVPIRSHTAVAGFIALANKKETPYAPIDLSDIQALLQAFAGALHRHRLEQSNSHNEKRLKLALDSANEGLWDFTPGNDQVYFSPRWYTMLGYSMDELPSTMETWHTLTHPEDLSLLKDTFNQLIDDREVSFRIEIRMLSQTAQWRWIQVRGSAAERSADGRVARILGTLNDISQFKQVELALQKANAELQRLAALDDLTQIANRRRFDERLLQEWQRARRDHTPLAVVLCDIDFFKSYNDYYGHLKGDDALHAVAQAIQGVLKRSMDLVARFGGEEFAIILPNTDVPGATRVANDVREAVKNLQIEHQQSKINPHITCSYGVASLIPTGNVTSKTLIEHSDKALYQAKARGRNRIVPYREDNDPKMIAGNRALNVHR